MYRASELGGSRWVVKAQIYSGGRGKAGGIKVCDDSHEIWDASESLLGRRLVTAQTGPAGKPIYRLYVEPAYNILSEKYFGLVLDRSRECIVAVGSAEGGMDIEELAESRPDAIIRTEIEPAVGMQMFQAKRLAYQIGVRRTGYRPGGKHLSARLPGISRPGCDHAGNQSPGGNRRRRGSWPWMPR